MQRVARATLAGFLSTVAYLDAKKDDVVSSEEFSTLVAKEVRKAQKETLPPQLHDALSTLLDATNPSLSTEEKYLAQAMSDHAQKFALSKSIVQTYSQDAIQQRAQIEASYATNIPQFDTQITQVSQNT